MKKENISKKHFTSKKLKGLAVCAVLVVFALLLCGCMKMHIDIVWNADNSATVSMTVGVSTSMLTLMDMTKDEIQAQLREGMEEDGEDYTFKNFSDDEYTGITATVNVKDITQGSSVDSVSGLNFTCTEGANGKKTYSVTGSLSGSDVTGGGAGLAEAGVDLADIDMKFSISMPGNITNHNAVSKNGNKLTWDLISTATSSISATSEAGKGAAGGGGNMLWLWIVIIAVVVIGVVVILLLVISKKKSAAQLSAPPYGSSPSGYDPYQAPGAQPQAAPPPYGGAATGYDPYQQPGAQPQGAQPQAAPPPYGGPATGYDSYQQPGAQPQAAPPPYGGAATGYDSYQQPGAQPQAQQWQTPATSVRHCPQCGALLSDNAKFCVECGATTTT